MGNRGATESAVGILLTLVFSVVGAGLFQFASGESAATAFLSSGPHLMFSTLGLPLVVWAVLIVVANVRNGQRSAARALLVNIGMSVACAALSVLAWFVIALTVGGWALFLMAISVLSGGIFVVSAVLALCLTHCVFSRRQTGRASAPPVVTVLSRT